MGTDALNRREHSKQYDQGTYFPALDGLRAIAVLAVIAYHFVPTRLPGGFLGVDIFFVLSGFLITSLLVRDAETSNRVDFKRFYVRRIRRLVPASFVLILAVIVITSLTGDSLSNRRLSKDAISSLLNVANWNFVLSGETYMDQFLGIDPSPLRHMWSLAVEEQFYLLWPFVVAAAIWNGRRSRSSVSLRRRLTQIITVGIVASLAVSLWLRSNGANLDRLYFGTDVRTQQILAGALLAVLLPKLKSVVSAAFIHALATLVCLPMFAVIMFNTEPSSTWLYQGGFLAVSVFALPLVWICTLAERPILTRLLSTRSLVAVGRVSYGLYLWHWPVHLWLDQTSTGLVGIRLLTLRVVLTVAGTLASWYLFENRIREEGLSRLRPALRPAVAFGALVFLFLAAMAGPKFMTPDFGTTTEDGSYDGAQSVSDAYYRSPLRCDAVKNVQGANDWKVVTLGNSLMKEIEPCLEEILSRQGATVIQRAGNADAICDIERGLIDKPLGETLEGTLIVFFHLPFWNRPCGFAIPEQDRDDYYRQALTSLVDSWIARGAKVLLVPTTPSADAQTPSQFFEFYEFLRETHPGSVYIADSGRYIRSSNGRYLYNMPCASVEIGCSAEGLIGVRLPVDGQHFCAYRDWQGEPCSLPDAGGERRVATAVAEDILSSITATS